MRNRCQFVELETRGVAVLRISGELNAKTTPEFLERCREILRSRRKLVLNFSDVSFIASSGVGALLAIVEEFREAGLGVRFTSLSPVVRSVIELLRLKDYLGIDGEEGESIAALGG